MSLFSKIKTLLTNKKNKNTNGILEILGFQMIDVMFTSCIMKPLLVSHLVSSFISNVSGKYRKYTSQQNAKG